MKKFTYLFIALLLSTISWQGIAQTAGESCDNPIVVALPFTATGDTGDYGNNYGSADRPALADGAIGNPSSSYLSGDDVVYAYTPSTDGFIDVTVTNHGSWAGVFVFTGCAFDSTVGGHTNSSATIDLEVIGLPVEAAETYYIVISTYAAPQTTSYTLNITETAFDCPILEANIGDACDDGNPNTINDVVNEDCECEGIFPPDGMVCEAPIVIASLPFTDTDNTENFGDNYENSNVPPLAENAIGNPSFFYLSGDDVVYAYTPSENAFIDVSVTDHGSWTGVYVFTGCAFDSTVGGHTNSSATIDLEVIGLPVEAGETYYIVISTNAAPQSTPYTLNVTETAFDCPILEANIGDACDDGDPTTANDAINEDCECEGEPTTPGEICENPLVIAELPYTTTDNTENYGDHYGPSDFPPLADGAIGSPSSGYLNGDDVVYTYTPVGDEVINISVTEHGSWAGVYVFTGCPFESTVGGHTNSSATTDLMVENLPVQGGVTYYIVISTYAAPQTTPYTLNITKLSDCDSASAGVPNEVALIVCAGTEFTIGVTGATEPSGGLERIWQSSPADDNDWTDIVGAFSESLTVTNGLLEATDYRFVVTCTPSSATDTSDVIQVSLNPDIAACYCETNATSVEAITYVGFGDIDNTTDASSTVGYEDFTDQSTEVELGETYEITLKGNTSGSFTNYFTVFVDWNQNGVLDDEGEMYLAGSIQGSTGIDEISATGNIIVPEGALSGETRMRVVKNYGSARTTPCGNFSFGQVEDYTINVVGDIGDTFPSPYCDIADAESVIVEALTKVVFDETTITNDDTDTVLINKTDIVIDVTAGETYTLLVEGNTEGDFQTNIVAFIDWNQNDILDDAGEIYELGTLANSTGSDGVSVTMDILVPADAVLGETRVRITKTYFDDISNPIVTPCAIEFDPFGWGIEAGYGQALDFTLNIEAGSTDDCTGIPDAGIATVAPETGEVNTSYTVSATGFTTGSGLTYQWQSNTDGAGWINEEDAQETYSPYMATAPAESDIMVEWRLEVTCTLSDEFSYSETATFTTVEPSLYCIPVLDCTDGDSITNVTFLDINNTSTCSLSGYGDYTNMVATVGPGNEYPISVTVGDGWDVESVSIWIDFDNNGNFDEEEFFFIGTGSGETLTSTIAIPNDATNGDYRMRVRVVAGPGSAATWDMSCDSDDGFGETEDYTVTVDETLNIGDHAISDFKYYPNPMTDVLHITANEEVKSVSVFNMLGQEVLRNMHFTNGKVDATSLPTGTFLFRVTFDNGHVENFQVIKK